MVLTLSKMASRVSERINKTDSAYLTNIKNWIDERYDSICNRENWPALLRAKESGFTMVSGQAELILPKEAERLLVAVERSSDNPLFQSDAFTQWQAFSNTIDNQGTPDTYFPLGTV